MIASLNLEKKIVFDGIQSSGFPHLGNLLGCILPYIELLKEEPLASYFFIADLHSLTSLKDGELRKKIVLNIVATLLSCGLNVNKTILFLQSKISEITELNWYLSCYTPYSILTSAHSFKDKSQNLANINVGLFVYPILMSADMLMFDANIVPVGKDQLQHLEIARSVAKSFNFKHGSVFSLPYPLFISGQSTIPGTDGRKMSKSYNNIIDIFAPLDILKKQILSIKTSSKKLDEDKDCENCNVFKIYSAIATEEEIFLMKDKYKSANYGYVMAKEALFDKIVEKFSFIRDTFDKLKVDKSYLEDILNEGNKKAKKVASKKISQVKEILNF